MTFPWVAIRAPARHEVYLEAPRYSAGREDEDHRDDMSVKGAGRLLTRVGHWTRAVRHAPDRWLHEVRRRQVLRGLKSQGVIERAIFICHGNINRSAYAASVFSKVVSGFGQSPIAVSSAGFIGPGRPASELAQRVASRRGIDLSGHRSRIIDAHELRSADLIVVMSTSQRRAVRRITRRTDQLVVVLGDLDSEPIVRRSVQDPYGHPEEVFVEVFDRIDRCIAQLARGVRD